VCPSRERLGAQALTAVIDRERAIKVGVDVDTRSGVAAPIGAGAELKEAPVELHGVITLDGALVLEAADTIEVAQGRGRPPGGLGVRGGLSESGIVAWEKPSKHALGLRERARVAETELDDQAILKGAKEPLDPSLRLRGLRADPADAELLERAPDLGGLGPALKLLGHGQRGARIAVEDPMAVGVRRTGETKAADEVAEKQEVAVGILLQAEDPAEDPARGVIDGCVEYETRAAIFEPGVMAAVHLDEESGLGHAFTAAAMARWAAGAGAADPGRAEEPLHRPTRQTQALALGKQLGEVVIIHARIAGAGQGEDAGADGLRETPRGRPAAVAVGEGSEALLA